MEPITPKQQQKAREIVAESVGGGGMYSNAEIAVRLADRIAAALAEAGGVKAQRTEEELQAVGFQRCPLCRCSVAKDYLEDRMSEYVVEAGGAQGDRFIPAPETEASRNDPEERMCVACGKPSWAHSCNRPPLGATATPQGDLANWLDDPEAERLAKLYLEASDEQNRLRKEIAIALAAARNSGPQGDLVSREAAIHAALDPETQYVRVWESCDVPDAIREGIADAIRALPAATPTAITMTHSAELEHICNRLLKDQDALPTRIETDYLLSALAATPTGECVWTPDEDGNYWSSCGEAHQFTVGGPADNKHRGCPYCLRKLVDAGKEGE